MTEAEYLACNDPVKMRRLLEGRASQRKLALFGVACCRRILESIPLGVRHALDVLEQAAEGMVSREDLDAIQRNLSKAYESAEGGAQCKACQALESLANYFEDQSTPWWVAFHASGGYRRLVDEPGMARRERQAFFDLEFQTQASLLRDIIGNPFRQIRFDPIWLRWNDATVPKLAQSIYDARDFSLMPILADALEDAGCDNADILSHCRQPGEHVRGCWVIDLLLGKS